MSSELREISAEDELVRSRMGNWRAQLLGAALITLTVALALGRSTPNHPLWLWVAMLWLLFTAQAWLCLRLSENKGTLPLILLRFRSSTRP